MTLDSTISLVITFFAVILVAIFVIAPFFGLWWAISNYRIRKQAYKYLQSPDFQKDMEELKAGTNYIPKETKGGNTNGNVQKERSESSRNSNTSRGRTDTNKETPNITGYRKIGTGESSIKAEPSINQSRSINSDRNKRRVTLH